MVGVVEVWRDQIGRGRVFIGSTDNIRHLSLQ